MEKRIKLSADGVFRTNKEELQTLAVRRLKEYIFKAFVAHPRLYLTVEQLRELFLPPILQQQWSVEQIYQVLEELEEEKVLGAWIAGNRVRHWHKSPEPTDGFFLTTKKP